MLVPDFTCYKPLAPKVAAEKTAAVAPACSGCHSSPWVPGRQDVGARRCGNTIREVFVQLCRVAVGEASGPIHSLIKWSGTPAFRSTAKTKTPEHVESATLPCSVQPIEYIALVKQPTVHSCKQVSIQSGRVLAQTCANGSGISMSRFALAVFGCCSHLCQTLLRT